MSHIAKPDPKAPWIVERGPHVEEDALDELADELERAKALENPEDEGDGA